MSGVRILFCNQIVWIVSVTHLVFPWKGHGSRAFKNFIFFLSSLSLNNDTQDRTEKILFLLINFSARLLALAHINKRKEKSIIESNLTNVHRNRIQSPINNTHTHGLVLKYCGQLFPYALLTTFTCFSYP